MVRAVITLEEVLAKSPADAAAFWLVRQDGGESEHDDLVFEQWLQADPAHGREWARACEAWEGVAALDAEEMDELRKSSSRSAWWRDWRSAAAASIAAIAIGCGALLWTPYFVEQPDTQIASLNDPGSRLRKLATLTGERRSFTLEDRSVVTLNTGSTLLVRFGPAERRITLVRGQVYFDVAHDAAKPFIVESAGSTITATGTHFEVETGDESMRVILVEGRVQVVAPWAGKAKPIDLLPGQQLLASRSGVTVGKADLASVSEWQNGLVSFRDTPLSQAVLELNRYSTGKHLLIRDPKVAAIRISGSFHTGDLRRFARTIAEIYPVRAVESANVIELVSRGRPLR
ncbi:FecR family protein [Flavisphingomonas formosensis]|uniref:FecR family protein n=1 Tax=Flavisphingomonas formosensis TaxID=861534 RepID=UPI0012FADC8F|nr:FecR domain-containing protein [Sphingomonas formosensis]